MDESELAQLAAVLDKPSDAASFLSNLGISTSNFSVWNLGAGLIFGTFGWIIFKKGKKESYPLRMIIGGILFIYPYFITNSFFLWLVGMVLTIFNYKFL